MLRAVEHRNRPCWPFTFSSLISLLSILTVLLSSTLCIDANPLPSSEEKYQGLVSVESTNNPMANNSTDNSAEMANNTDVYVIKAVVYEIGILTDSDNTTSESTERHERVDISLYDPSYRKEKHSEDPDRV